MSSVVDVNWLHWLVALADYTDDTDWRSVVALYLSVCLSVSCCCVALRFVRSCSLSVVVFVSVVSAVVGLLQSVQRRCLLSPVSCLLSPVANVVS